jgi:hypothetical protein
MLNTSIIQSELSDITDKNKCCIIFNFPFNNKDLKFCFSLGINNFNDFVLNHRYPNKSYSTITKRYGRRLSKIGYPVFVDFDECNTPMILKIIVGRKENIKTLLFPLKIHLTKDKPVCALNFHYYFNESRFVFKTFEPHNNGFQEKIWSSIDTNENRENIVIFDTPEITKDNTYIYSDVINPAACQVNKLFLIG